MGLTALDGLVMGTRCGTIDPGAVLYLMQTRGMSVDDVTNLLYEQSGLLGVSGLSADMRVLLASNSPDAAEAVALFAYRAAGQIGASLRLSMGWIAWSLRPVSANARPLCARPSACGSAGWAWRSTMTQINEMPTLLAPH